MCDGVSNHRRLDCLRSRFFRRRSRKTSPATGGFPPQRASNAEIVPFDDVIMPFHFRKYERLLCIHIIYAYDILNSWLGDLGSDFESRMYEFYRHTDKFKIRGS